MSILGRLVLPGFLMLCLLLGGANRGGYLANMVLQLLGTGLIVWALWSKPGKPLAHQERTLAWLVAAGCLVILLQFLPLPLPLWEALGSRATILKFDRMAGFEPSPAFVSLMPHESLKSAVWILPALGLLLAMLRRGTKQAQPMAWVIVGIVALSVLLGALQLTGGQDSPWYFYARTNYGATVGFFSNSNHLATLLLISIPFLAALLAGTRSRRSSKHEALFLVGSGLLALILVGIFANGSLLGYGLVLPVLAASATIVVPKTLWRKILPAIFLPLILVGTVLSVTTETGREMLSGIKETQDWEASSQRASGARDVVFANTIKGIIDYLPTGAGLGSFVEIYPQYEDPGRVSYHYRNHAHNDYLEILLETGIPGALALAAFLIWWGRRAYLIWTAKEADRFSTAAVIASAVVLLHSLVDYPLRTAAISSVFAICLVLMAGWIAGDRVEMRRPAKS